MTFAACDVIANALLSGLVERLEELVELFLDLAAEYRQKLLVLSHRQHLGVDGPGLILAEYLGLLKSSDKSLQSTSAC